jgi:hypothetical protein
MASHIFTSLRNPMVCVMTTDASGESLPAEWGPWVKTTAPWDGKDAGFIAGIRDALEEHSGAAEVDPPIGNAPPVHH